MKKRLINILFSKMMITAYIIIFELFLIFLFVSFLSSISKPISLFLKIFSVVMVIYVYNRNDNPSYKLAWTSVILALPTVGGVLYMLFGGKKVSKEPY